MAIPAERQWRFWLIGFCIFMAILYLLRPVLLPFVAGMAVAYFLDPAADFLEKHLRSRSLAVTVITLLFILVLGLLAVLVIPLITSQLWMLIERLPSAMDQIDQFFSESWHSIQDFFQSSLGISLDALYAKDNQLATAQTSSDQTALPSPDLNALGLQASLQQGLQWLATILSEIVNSSLIIVNVISLLIITPVVSFYLLRDWDIMIARIHSWLPQQHATTIVTIAREMDDTLSNFVRGVSLVCLSLGSFYAIGLGIVGLEYALIVGLFAGLISFVPYLGTILGLVASIGLALLQIDSLGQDWPFIAQVFAIFVAGQILEGYVFTPRFVGHKVGLHPVWVMFAIMAGGSLFGFVGILLAVPIAALLGVLVRFFLQQYLDSSFFKPKSVIVPSVSLNAPQGSEDITPSDKADM